VPVRLLREGFPAFFLSPHVPPSSPRVGAEGGQGEGEGAPGVRRSTGPETVKTLFHRLAETHALPASVFLPDQYGDVLVAPHQQPRFLIML